ncbi:hypothetical protein MAR_005700 [Mya arenaria]|uniref:Uncharacterized protein n=1 Tax=Mya arenaria TaxID=6604 RepID=A0ABY7F1Q1_MYAAR|nr:hypothetical protein MAR_005700 [Mya arenaria]
MDSCYIGQTKSTLMEHQRKTLVDFFDEDVESEYMMRLKRDISVPSLNEDGALELQSARRRGPSR